MTLSKQQIENDKFRFQKWFWIWERDLLWLAQQFPDWHALAHNLGFKHDKIFGPWLHADAGKLVRYIENPYFAMAGK